MRLAFVIILYCLVKIPNGRCANWRICGIELDCLWPKVISILGEPYYRQETVEGMDVYRFPKASVLVVVHEGKVHTITGKSLQDGNRTFRAGEALEKLHYLGPPQDKDDNYVVYLRSGTRLLVKRTQQRIVGFTLERG